MTLIFAEFFLKFSSVAIVENSLLKRTENTIMSLLNGLESDPFPKPR